MSQSIFIKIDFDQQEITSNLSAVDLDIADIANLKVKIAMICINSILNTNFDLVEDTQGNSLSGDVMLNSYSYVIFKRKGTSYQDQFELIKTKFGKKAFLGLPFLFNVNIDMELQERSSIYSRVSDLLQSQVYRANESHSKLKSKLICVSGAPGIGKSRFLVDICENIVFNSTKQVVLGITFNSTTSYKKLEEYPIWSRVYKSLELPFTPGFDTIYYLKEVISFCNNPDMLILLIDEYNNLKEDLEKIFSLLTAIQTASVNILHKSFSIVLCGTNLMALEQAVTQSGTLAEHISLPLLSKKASLFLFKSSSFSYNKLLYIISFCSGVPRLIETVLQKQDFSQKIEESMFSYIQPYIADDAMLLACCILSY